MKTDKSIGKELNEIAPILGSIKKPENKTVSSAYFATVKESVLTKIRQEEAAAELNVLAPLLSTIPKPTSASLNRLNVPANYFENLPDKVLATIQKREKQVTREAQPSILEIIVAWIKATLFQPQYAVTFATILSAVLLSGIYLSNSTEARTNQQLALATQSLTQDDIEAYVLDNSEEFEETTLETEVIESKVNEEDIAREELQAYFAEENIIEEDIAI